MSLSTFVSFQSRFVTYLLTFPRTYLPGSNHASKCRGTVEQKFTADGRQFLASPYVSQ